MNEEERRNLRKKLKKIYQILSCSILSASVIIGSSPTTREAKSIFDIKIFRKNEKSDSDELVAKIDDKKFIIETEPTNETKMAWIMEHYNITLYQLKDIIGGMIAESFGGGYDETYRVTSVLYNRIHSKEWVYSCGSNIYEQFTYEGQFEVYATGYYKNYTDRTDLEEYQAVIDMLYSCSPSINYLSFRSAHSTLNFSYMQYQNNGNKFFSVLKDNDRIDELTDNLHKRVRRLI